MKFRGVNGEDMEVRKSRDRQGHDHLEIVKDGVVQWQFHIHDNKFTVSSGDIPRPKIHVDSFCDLVTLTKEIEA